MCTSHWTKHRSTARIRTLILPPVRAQPVHVAADTTLHSFPMFPGISAWTPIAIESSLQNMSSERLRQSLSWFKSRPHIETQRSGSRIHWLATNTPTLKR